MKREKNERMKKGNEKVLGEKYGINWGMVLIQFFLLICFVFDFLMNDFFWTNEDFILLFINKGNFCQIIPIKMDKNNPT